MEINDLKTVCVIGAGDMGHGIAQLALMNGYCANLCDTNNDYVNKGISRIYGSINKLTEKGEIPSSVINTVKDGKLCGFTEVSKAVRNSQFIIEAVPEKLPVKEAVLREISKHADSGAVIASNTSTMSITMLAQFIINPERFIGTHYFNPPALMKLVEVINGENTSEETARFACDYVTQINKVLIHAKKDTPGFIANRITAPVIIYNGLCVDIEKIEPADIDATMMKAGLKMGPMELADYTGLDVMCNCLEYYREHLSPEYEIYKTLREKCDLNHFGKKTGCGFYIWPSTGRPSIDKNSSTGKYNVDIPFFIYANEACKLVECGICSTEDCDKAMIYGFNMPGPFDYIRQFKPDEVTKALDTIAERYKKKIFCPTDTIRKGIYFR